MTREHEFMWRGSAVVAVVLAVVTTTTAHVFWGLPTPASVAIGVCNGFLGVTAAAAISAQLTRQPTPS
jgi:hypothetical protein